MKLKQLIDQELLIPVENNSVLLTEEKNKTIKDKELLRSLTIQNLPGNFPDTVFAFSKDKKHGKDITNQYLNKNNEKINKFCDTVIVHQNGNALHIVACELKSVELDPDKYEYQLVNAHCFLDYIVNLYNVIYATHGTLLIESIRYVLFHFKRTQLLAKQATRNSGKGRATIQNLQDSLSRVENMQKIKDRSIIIYPLFEQEGGFVDWEILTRFKDSRS